MQVTEGSRHTLERVNSTVAEASSALKNKVSRQQQQEGEEEEEHRTGVYQGLACSSARMVDRMETAERPRQVAACMHAWV